MALRACYAKPGTDLGHARAASRWGVSKWEWERLRQTLDATGSGSLQISDYLEIHTEVLHRTSALLRGVRY
eukprot:3404422-Rhodomonas_salina.6